MSNAIKGHETELPFKHIALLNDTNECVELKSCPPSILVKDNKHYQIGETKSTADHEFTYMYNLVESLHIG